MTALKPTETRRVRGVASERYPPNRVSAHPDSREPATDQHHIFPRSQQVGDSWFVEVAVDTEDEAKALFGDVFEYKPQSVMDGPMWYTAIIPHVTGLSREEHRQVEEHEAWIRLEEGVFNWYDREDDEWVLLGPLNPQPGSRDAKSKKRRFKGEARKQRKVISVRVPDTADENGAEVWDVLIEEATEELRPENPAWSESVPPYFVLTKVVADWLQSRTKPSRRQRWRALRDLAEEFGIEIPNEMPRRQT